MPKWRSARLRRLYGSPTDPIENSDDASTTPGPSVEQRAVNDTTLPPPPKRVRREKTRPESEYELVHNMPVTQAPPDYSLLVNPLSEKQANIVAYAVHASRSNWLSGSMFETFWTRKPRGKKANDNQPNLRDKMTKLHECAVTLGPHTFPVRLFTVKDDNVHVDEEADRKVEEILALAERERQAKEEAERENEPDLSRPVVKEELGTPALEPSLDAAQSQMAEPLNDDADNHQNGTEVTRPIEAPEHSQHLCADDNVSAESSREDEPNSVNHAAPRYSEGKVDVAAEVGKSTPALDPADEPQNTTAESPIKLESTTASTPSAELSNSSPHFDTARPASAAPSSPADSADDSKIATGRRKARPKASSEQPLNTENTVSADIESPERKRSFEMEKQNLEAEKKRVEELEKKLKSHSTTQETNGESEGTSASVGTASVIAQNEKLTPSPVEGSAPIAIADNADASLLPPPPPIAPPRAVPNELVVSKLQQMAARDSNLGELMRVVASQTASHEEILKFQEIINRVKASIFTQPTPAPKVKTKPKAKAVPQVQRAQPTYPTRAHSKAIMLAIEFDENPAERHLLPKRSILEYIPSDGQLLWSFLHVVEDGKSGSSEETQPQKIYTPVTATFHDIPLKVAQTLERCVRKPEVVAHYMKETMNNATRSEPWHLWYRIEKNDEVLLESIKKQQAPTMAPPPPPRKPMKPRKLRPASAADSTQHARYRRLGEPLIQTRAMIIGRRGQPMVQSPSYYQQILRRPRGASNYRTIATPASAGPAAQASLPSEDVSRTMNQIGKETTFTQNTSEANGETHLGNAHPTSVHISRDEVPPSQPLSIPANIVEEEQNRSHHNVMESKMEVDS